MHHALAKLVPVGPVHLIDVILKFDLQFVVLIPKVGGSGFAGLHEKGAKVEVLRGLVEFTGFDPGQIDELVGQVPEGKSSPDDGAEFVEILILLLLLQVLLQDFTVTDNVIEGGAQFMAEVFKEGGLGPAGLFSLDLGFGKLIEPRPGASQALHTACTGRNDGSPVNYDRGVNIISTCGEGLIRPTRVLSCLILLNRINTGKIPVGNLRF